MTDAEQPAAPAAPESNPAPSDDRLAEINALIDQWHLDNFRGARGVDVDVWNLIYAAKENLKQRLAAHLQRI